MRKLFTSLGRAPLGLPLALALVAATGTGMADARSTTGASVGSGSVVQVNTGRGRLVTLSRPMSDVFVADESIADVQVAEGNSGMARLLALPPESFLPAGFTDREVLARWLRSQETIEPANDGRWTRAARGEGVP